MSCLPVLVLAMGTTLAHMLHADTTARTHRARALIKVVAEVKQDLTCMTYECATRCCYSGWRVKDRPSLRCRSSG